MITFTAATGRSVRLGAAVAAAATLVLSACSTGSVAESAEAKIAAEMSDDDLGELTASCTEPDTRDVGATFECTATGKDGQVVTLLGTMQEDDRFRVVTTNLLTAEDVEGIRADAAAQFREQTGVALTADDVECPTRVVVLDDTGNFECEITDPTDGTVYELIIKTGGLEPDEGARDLTYAIGDPID